MRSWIVLVLVWIYLWRLGAAGAQAAAEAPLPLVLDRAPLPAAVLAAPVQGPALDDEDDDDDGDDDGGDDGNDDGGGDDGDGDDGDDGGDDGNDDGGREDDHRDDGGDENDHEDEDDHEDDDHAYAATYSFYGQVRWSGDRTVVGNRELVGDDAWLHYLAPGMRLEVKGQVEGTRIRVDEIEIKYPKTWSYYLGPARVIGLEGGWVRAWLAGGDGRSLFKLLPAETPGAGSTPELLACYEDGAWRSVPLSLRPQARPQREGWWRLEGRVQGGRIVGWTPVERLPGDCD